MAAHWRERTFCKPLIGSVLLCLSLLLFLVIIVSNVQAAEEKRGLAPLIEGAKKEGKVTWYGAMNLEEALPLVKKFEQKYPFVKVEYVRAKGEVNANRILAEARADKIKADIFGGKLRALLILKNRGLLAKYKSPEHEFYPEGVKDPDEYWTTQYLSAYIISYNTKLVKPREVPKNYEGLLDPRWKGKIGIDAYDYDWFTGMLEIMGREKGIAYMQALAKQAPVLRVGHTLLSQLLAAGEFCLTTEQINAVARMKKINAPVEWARFDFPSPTSLTSMSLLAKPQHPYAAKLLYEYLLSREANEFLPTVGRISPRKDVQFPEIPKDFKFFPLSGALLDDVIDRNMKEFDRIFKKGRQ